MIADEFGAEGDAVPVVPYRVARHDHVQPVAMMMRVAAAGDARVHADGMGGGGDNIIDRDELLREIGDNNPAGREDAEEFVYEPLRGHQWIQRLAPPAPPPAGGEEGGRRRPREDRAQWCYMCNWQVDQGSPHYQQLRRWAETPIGDMRFIVANMARVYEKEIRRAGTVPLPAWPKYVIWQHLHVHDISPARVTREAFAILTAKVDNFVEIGQRKRMRSDGTQELCASDAAQDNMLLKYLAARDRVAANYHAQAGRRDGETS